MPRKKYASFQIPEDFVKATIDPFIEDNTLGFSSRAEVIKAAIRDFHAKHFPLGTNTPTSHPDP